MTRIGMLTALLSQRSAGLYEAVGRLSLALRAGGGAHVSIFGLADAARPADAAAWRGVPTTAARVRGPLAWGYSAELTPALDAAKLDLLHVHGLWMYPSVAARRWASKERPYIVAPHGMLDPWAIRHSGWKKRLAAALYEGGHLRGAACLHALCDAEAEAIRAFGVRRPVCVVPNPIPEPPAPSDDDAAPPASLADAEILLYLGRLHPKKGLAPFLRGWSEARRGGGSARDWRLAVAGFDQGGHEAELRRIVAELDLADSVVFLGPVFDARKHALYRAASGFVLPSFSEGVPMAALEAWSHGLPVLMTSACNLPESFAAGAALSIDGPPAAVAATLRDFFDMSAGQRRKIGEIGRRIALERFSPPAVARRMNEVYAWILDGGSPPACVQTT